MDIPEFFCKYCGNKIIRDASPQKYIDRGVINLSKDRYNQCASNKNEVKDNDSQGKENYTNINVQDDLRTSRRGSTILLMVVSGAILVIIGSIIINIIQSIGMACIMIGVFDLIGAMFVAIFDMVKIMKIASDKEEMQLQMIVEQIQEDIKNKDYISAKIKADTLCYSGDWSYDIKRKWKKTRESLLKHIEEAENKSRL